MSRARSRFALAIAALVALGLALAACGSDGDKSDENAQGVLEEATLDGVESAAIDLSFELKSSGSEGGALDASVSGSFQSEGQGQLPQLDLTATAKGSMDGEKVDLEGGVVLLPNSAYVNYEGTEYEVDPATFAYLESALKEAQRKAGAETGSAGATACQEEFGELDVAGLLEGGVNEGGAEVDGTATTKVSGDLDVSGGLDALLEVVESPACRSQLDAAGQLPSEAEIEEAKDEVGSAVKDAHVDVYVGDDDIVRQISAQLTIEPEDRGSGPKRAEVDLELKLSGVNEEQKIAAPEDAKPLTQLFVKLRIDPLVLLGLLEGEAGGEELGELFERLGLPDVPYGS